MNLKYYLRGLGIGVLVTALIMGIAGSNTKETLSNEEIKAKAKSLGMIESRTILEDTKPSSKVNQKEESSKEEPKEVPTEEQTEEPTEMPTQTPTTAPIPESTTEPTMEPTTVPTMEPIVAPTLEPTMKTTEKPTSKPTVKPKSTDDSDEEEEESGSITITVNRGEGSYTVCKKLEDAGLIASASDFDTYLCKNGYDKQVKTGSHDIPEGAEPDQIAQILSGQN